MDTEFYDDDALYRWEFKNKGYAHFDAEYCRDRVEALVASIEETKPVRHTFYPFIRLAIPKRKRDENNRIFIDTDNPRHIMHTARVDSNIYSYFRNILMNKYEEILSKLGVSECVIAYRKIPLSGIGGKGKCNVHFANEAIEEIKKRTIKSGSCTAITMDISKFFDSLDHGVIKKQWCRVLGSVDGLPKSHFTIFKNITRFKYVDAKLLQNKLRFKFSKLRKDNIKQICTPEEFREKVLPVLSAENKIGIPQGTTISDVIANMYMLDFDCLMNKFAVKYNGYYRRYSDDILLIVPVKYNNKAIRFINKSIGLTGKTLKINQNKTLISHFTKVKNGIKCASYIFRHGKPQLIGKPFEYLGLSFDGCIKRIRQSTISKFHDKLSHRIQAEVQISRSKLVKKGIKLPNQNEIFNIISFDMIRSSYMEYRGGDNDFIGNFYTYVQLVADVTGNKNVSDVFQGLGSWIKKRAKKYCGLIVEKHLRLKK